MALDALKIERVRDQIRKKADVYLWQQDFDALPFWKRLLLRSAQIVYAISRDIAEGQLSLRAMSLVYSTVLGFVPTLALVFAVLKSLGAANNLLEPWLLGQLAFLGDRTEETVEQIITFVNNIQFGVIGATSLGLLIYLVLDMMRKIEISFNYIWSVSQARSWSNRVSEYLFAVIVSPLLIFISISITSSVNTVFFSRFLESIPVGSQIVSFFAFLAPLLFMSLAFAFAYSFLPNTKVRFTSAFIGGIVTTIVWKLMGAFFGGFLVTAARESIYLAFATVVALMIFAYAGWLVALLGSNIAYYHQYPNKARHGRRPVPLSINQREQLTLTTAALIIQRFQNRQPPLDEEEIAAWLGTNPMTTSFALGHLLTLGLVAKTDNDPPRYLPTASVADCTLYEIWRTFRDMDAGELQKNDKLPEYRQVEEFLSHLHEAVDKELGNRKFFDAKDESER